MEKRLVIGKIVTTIGLKGELKVMPETKDITRFMSLKKFFIENDNHEYVCEKAIIRGNFVALKIEGLNKVEDVENFKNLYVLVDRQDAIKLNQDEYFICDLIGCKIASESGNEYGIITDIENFGASDIIVFEKDHKEFSVPYIKGIFKNVNLETKSIIASNKIEEVIVCE